VTVETETQLLLDDLRDQGYKITSPRQLVIESVAGRDENFTAEELTAELAPIGRATIYRTLQWMVDAGIARRVDFGEGRFRFEHSYRHPRHFHLICKSCDRSFEFLSSDIEGLLEEIAAARHFSPRQSVLQIYGTCEQCRTGRPSRALDGSLTEAVFARDALRIAIATERSGLEFYTRAARLTKDTRGRQVFERLAGEEGEHLAKLEARYGELVAARPGLEAEPTFLFFKGAANGLFAAGSKELRQGDGRAALLIGIRCERGSYKFFKRYGERFEESEGKRVFLEFADEEREHLDLLRRERARSVLPQVEAPQQLTAFETKAIDAAMTVEPWGARFEERGVGVRFLMPDQVKGLGPVQIAAIMYSGRFIKERRAVAQRWMDAYVKGARFFVERGAKDDEVAAIIEKHTKVPAKVVKTAIPHYQAVDGRPIIESLADQIKWHTANGYMPKPVAVEQVVDLSFLK